MHCASFDSGKWTSGSRQYSLHQKNTSLLGTLVGDSGSNLQLRVSLRVLVSTFHFFTTTHFLADILAVLSHVSKIFQSQCVDFTTISDNVESTVDSDLIHESIFNPRPSKAARYRL